MKEYPILFSSKMVNAILNGRKKVTRRMTNLETINNNITAPYWEGAYLSSVLYDGSQHKTFAVFSRKNKLGDNCFLCPYGNVGDLLWVRESFAFSPQMGSQKAGEVPIYEPIYYMADGFPKQVRGHGRPSIHMPKDRARIWLRVESINVERLQSISDDDAIAEGIESYQKFDDLKAYVCYQGRKDFLEGSTYSFNFGAESQSAPVASFCTLWMDINGRDSWVANPWVWVVKFKVLSTTGRPALADQEAAAV